MEPKWPRIVFFKSYGFQSLEKEGTLSPKRGKAMLPKTLQDAPDMLTRIPKTTQQPPRRTKMTPGRFQDPHQDDPKCFQFVPGHTQDMQDARTLTQGMPKSLPDAAKKPRVLFTVRRAACFASGRLDIEARILFSELFATLANGNNSLKK